MFGNKKFGGSVEYIVVGLGNPDKKYENTRHNTGWLALDHIAEKLDCKVNRIKFKSFVGECSINGKKVLLMKPTTYMNNSGQAVVEAMNFYKILPENVIVIFDDISLAGNIFLQSEICGLNVTIPYKQQIIPLLNEVDKDAQAIGSVNVIKFVRKGELVKTIGFNTDIIGFHDSIAPHIRSHHKSALILGTGGASKAVAHCLRSLGISIDFASRTSGNGKMAYTDLTEQIVSSHQIIVNTTPLGMFPNVDACPDIPYQGISSSHICFDLTYNPAETLFLRKSKQYGADTINGMEMLIGQALAAWRIWND